MNELEKTPEWVIKTEEELLERMKKEFNRTAEYIAVLRSKIDDLEFNKFHNIKTHEA